MATSTLLIDHFAAIIKLEDSFPNSVSEVKSIADKLIKSLGLTVIKKIYHEFEPSGVTLVYILSQSHLAIHTWPERKTIHVDLLSCSPITGESIRSAINSSFERLRLNALSIKKCEV